jgi:2-amino-4-hydroxy-6-hydroxymethyldihydropteridine diphosphokinase
LTDLPPFPVALALGSNLGDRLGTLRKTVQALAPIVKIDRVSDIYETAPAYVTDQPVFLNAALVGTTQLEPLPLLWAVKNLESEIGRTPTYRFGPRVIDIDIIFYSDLVLKTPELTLPHARAHERDFVLRPLSEIAPAWKHPVLGKTAAEMLALLPAGPMTCLGQVLL